MSTPSARDVAIAACAASGLVHAWLVSVHLDEHLLAASFAAATVGAAVVGYALTRPELRFAPLAGAVLFAGLLAAYPIVVLATDDNVDPLGLATKAVEAIGLAASLASRRRSESFGSADALVGFVLAVFLTTLGHDH
ncbi:MAG TPA: hypothetical protein VE444_03650 [Gaiellaceae bacterium]|nr:hypothetical protein [Gaiellaceae bacterium]